MAARRGEHIVSSVNFPGKVSTPVADTLDIENARGYRATPPEALWLGAISIFVGIALGCYLTLHLQYMSYDAVARIAHAYYVLFSRNPHFGAIGFVWTPLSSIMALPLVASSHLWPPLVRQGMAGVPISALFAGLGSFSLARLLYHFGIPKPWRVIMVLLYMLNPMILLYSANGMTDGMMVACVLATYDNLFVYAKRHSLRALVAAGLWVVVGLGVRYEALTFGLMTALGLAVGQLLSKVSWNKIQGTAIIFLAPLAFGGSLWLYFNWLIMKNPFYFLDGEYSNIAQTALSRYEKHIRAHVMHNPLAALLYVAHFTLLYWPIDLGILVGVFFLIGHSRDTFVPVIFGGIVGPLLLDFALLYKGSLAPWDRYFIYYIPSGAVLVSYLASRLVRPFPSKGWLVYVLSVILMLSGSMGTYVALQTHKLGNPDGYIIASALADKNMNAQTPGSIALIRYVNAHPHMVILTDEFTTGVPVVIQVNNPKQFIITSDYDYKSILYNPRGRVSAFLVPDPIGGAKLDDIDRAWPGLWSGKIPWAHEIRQFPNVDGITYRLYGIGPTAP